MSKGESLDQLSIQISNLRKCRDGLIPYSTDGLRRAKQSILEPVFPSSKANNEIPLRRQENKQSKINSFFYSFNFLLISRKRIKSEESTLNIGNEEESDIKSNHLNNKNSSKNISSNLNNELTMTNNNSNNSSSDKNHQSQVN